MTTPSRFKRHVICLTTALLCSMNAQAHVSIGIGIGVPAYAPAPAYYGPPPAYYYGDPGPYADEYDEVLTTTDVEWIPAHLEDGVWRPGRYVQYVSTAPGPDYIWVNGYWDSHHYWHRGRWNHHYYR